MHAAGLWSPAVPLLQGGALGADNSIQVSKVCGLQEAIQHDLIHLLHMAGAQLAEWRCDAHTMPLPAKQVHAAGCPTEYHTQPDGRCT